MASTTNLLNTPATVLDSAAGVVYFAVFRRGIGPLTEPAITSWLEDRRLGVLPPLVVESDWVGVAAKVIGAGRTVQGVFAGLDDAPSFGQANLELVYLWKGTDPRTLPNYVAQAKAIDASNPSPIERGLSQLQAIALTLAVATALYAAARLFPLFYGKD